MPISIDELRRVINPSKTALLLGAGASVPSGAPTGAQLAARLWRILANTDPLSEDLAESASILVRRYTRRPVAEAVRNELAKLKPNGGILGLPKFYWFQIYTTNFDRLVEGAFKFCGIPLSPIRSNYDFTNKETAVSQKLFKIHGCISQDASFGDKASMILTESDYVDFSKYRQAMFASLQTALLVIRALKTKGIAASDRVAMMAHAYEQAMRNTEFFRLDKYSYSVLCDVAIDLAKIGAGVYFLEEAIKHMRTAAERILDPEMDSRLQQYEKTLARMR